jgi:hypothetical protein
VSLPTVVELTDSDEDVVWATPLLETGLAVDVAAGDSATLRYRRADGTGTTETVDGSIDAAGDEVVFVLPAGMVSVPAGRQEIRYAWKIRYVSAAGSTRSYPSLGYGEFVVTADV